MAESSEGQDDILKCAICLEILNNPKYLPCLHTFCEHCLKSYITATVKENSTLEAETNVDGAEDVKTKVDGKIDDENKAQTKVKDETEGKTKEEEDKTRENVDTKEEVNTEVKETEGGSKENDGEEAKTDANGGVKAEFNCPFCRIIVLVPDPKSPVQEWASQFPNNHLIMTLLDKQKLHTKAKMCDPCQVADMEVNAVSWCKVCNEALCDVCAKYHRRMVATKQHKLSLISDQENDFEITRFEFCENHKDKQLEAFCFDHDQACCVSCISIDHRKCDKVMSLADAAKDVLKDPELAELHERLVETEKVLTTMLKISKENVSDIQTKKATMLIEVSELRKKINKHFDDIEANLAQEIKDVEKQVTTDINNAVFEIENRKKRVSGYRKVYDTAVSRATNIHVFLEMKKLESKQIEMEEYLKTSLKNFKRVDCKLDIAPELEEIILQIEQFGSVNIEMKPTHKEVSESVGNDLSRRIGLGSELFLYSIFDVPEKSICDCIFLPNEKLAFTSGSYKVYFCQDNGKDMTTFDFPTTAELFGLDILNENEIILCRPSATYNIQVVNFHEQKDVKQLKPSVKSKDISVLDKHVVTACGSKLVFMDFSGSVIKSIDVKPPVYNVASFDKNIYYTNTENSTMYGITLEGKRVFEYTHPDLQKPHGVTTDENGDVLVAGHGSSNVHQVSAEGNHVRIALTEKEGIVNPHALCFDKKNKRLLVSHSKNKISVFNRTW